MSDGGALSAGLRALTSALASLDADALVIGGVAVAALGHPRLTKDLDAAVDGTHTTPELLLERLAPFEIRPRIENAAQFARRSYVLLLEHAPSGTPIDLSLSFVPWELEALRHPELADFEGQKIPVPTPENLVVYKLVAFRPKDVEDARILAQLHHRAIDFARVRRVLAEFCAALEDDARLKELDRIEASCRE